MRDPAATRASVMNSSRNERTALALSSRRGEQTTFEDP